MALVAFLFVLHDKWSVGFWLLVSALATDFLDGLAAKKLNAISKFGEDFDALTDSLVVILGLVSLSVTGHLSWWITAGTLAVGTAIGSDRIFTQPRWKRRTVVAVTSLFVAWIGIVWLYADLAFGWSWLYVPLTAVILVGCGLLKRHRISAWFGS